MSLLLVDTDVVSFLFKENSRAETYAPILRGNRLAVSFMSVAELCQWAAIRKWGPSRIKKLEQRLTSYLVIPVDIELCRQWGRLRANLQSQGQAISAQDAWIAATALHYGLPIVTHNGRDFVKVPGLTVLTNQDKTS